MDRSIALLVIGLVFGSGIGFTIAAANGVTLDGHDHSTHSGHSDHSEHAGHDHGETVSLPAGSDAPTLTIEAFPDPVSGWNLRVITTNYRFAPENAGGDNVSGEGHAHVYINDQKLGRLYAEWMHLSNLPAGEVSVKVSLNANDHSPLAVDGVPLEQVIQISN